MKKILENKDSKISDLKQKYSEKNEVVNYLEQRIQNLQRNDHRIKKPDSNKDLSLNETDIKHISEFMMNNFY